MGRLPRLSPRFWVEIVLALAAAGLLVLTLVRRDWIEEVFGVDPDQNSGYLELGIVIAAVAALGLLLLARTEWRRARSSSPR